MADKSHLRFLAFAPDNTSCQRGDGGDSDDDPDQSHAPISWLESCFAMIGGYWMGSLEHVQNETTAD